LKKLRCASPRNFSSADQVQDKSGLCFPARLVFCPDYLQQLCWDINGEWLLHETSLAEALPKTKFEAWIVFEPRLDELLHSELLDQLAQSLPLDWPQIQELHAEHLFSDPPNDRMVNVHAPVIVWGEDPHIDAHTSLDGSFRLGCTACGGQVQECRISLYQFGT
jgi:hypothetical protein